MKVLRWDEAARGGAGAGGSAATIGVFDGLHLGHARLIRLIRSRAGLRSVVVTFEENPKRILHGLAFRGDILTLDQRLSVLGSLGVDITVLIDFSGDFGKLPGKDFLSLLSDACDLRYLAVGRDFRCGHRLDTGAEEIGAFAAERGFEVEFLRATMADGHPVSSSRIRGAIAEGRLSEASVLMDRPFEVDLRGAAIAEDGRIGPAGRQVLPPDGVYEVLVGRSGSFEAARAELREGAWHLGAGDPRGADALRVIEQVSRE